MKLYGSLEELVKGLYKDQNGSEPSDSVSAGDILIYADTAKLAVRHSTSTVDEFTWNAAAQTLTNKTLTSAVLTTPQINDTSADHQYIFAVSELLADRTVTLPLLAGNDTFVFADFIQTLTNKTLTSPTINNPTVTTGAFSNPVLTLPQINNVASSYQYIFAVSALLADRTVTLPLLIGDDTFVFEDHIQTLANKTLTAPVATTSMTLSNQAELRLSEQTGNGTDYVSLKAPASMTGGNVDLVLPNSDGDSGQFMYTDGSGNLGWSDGLSTTNLADQFIRVGNNQTLLDAIDTTLLGDITSQSTGSFTFETSDVNAGTDVITQVAHGLNTNDTVHFTSGGTLPAGISADTTYYVHVTGLDADTFSISESHGGLLVNITDVGTGTHTCYHGGLNLDLSVQRHIETITSSTTLKGFSGLVTTYLCDTTSGAQINELPWFQAPDADLYDGARVIFKKISSDANQISIESPVGTIEHPTGSESAIVLTSEHDYVELVYDSTNTIYYVVDYSHRYLPENSIRQGDSDGASQEINTATILGTNSLLDSSYFPDGSNLYAWHNNGSSDYDDGDWDGSKALTENGTNGLITSTNHLGSTAFCKFNDPGGAVDNYLSSTDAVFDNDNVDFTAYAWIKPDDLTGFQVIISKWTDDANKKSWILYLNGSEITAIVSKLGSDTTGLISATAEELLDGNYHFVAVVYDTSVGSVAILLDGKIVAYQIFSDLIDTRFNDDGSDLLIGASYSAGVTNFFAGDITEFGFKEDALTANELRKIYAAGSRKFVTEGGDSKVAIIDGRCETGNYVVIPNTYTITTSFVLATGHEIYIPEDGYYEILAEGTIRARDDSTAPFCRLKLYDITNGADLIGTPRKFILSVAGYFDSNYSLSYKGYFAKDTNIGIYAVMESDDNNAQIAYSGGSSEPQIGWTKLD